MTQYAYTILYVEDVARALTFYCSAFGFAERLTLPSGDYAEAATGQTVLAFAARSLAESNLPKGFLPASPSEKPFGIELGFTTDDVAQTIEQAVAAGATLYQAPQKKPWGQTVAYLRDPEGFLIEVCTPMG